MRRAFLLSLALYALWTRWGRRPLRSHTDARLELQQSFGMDRHRGNLVGVQPWMTAADYNSGKTFFGKLNEYLQSAAVNGWLNEKTVIVLPEYLGTWLLLAGEKRLVGEMHSITLGMLILILSNPIRFLWYLIRSGGDPTKAIFRMNAKSIASLYHHTFSQLARKYGVTIAAGSVLLPSPCISGGTLTVPDVFAPLENISVLYRRDGSPDPVIVRKVHTTPDEASFTRAASATSLPVYESPVGRLGSLICADSWYPDVYAALQKQRCEVVVTSAWVYPRGCMDAPWLGYAPPDSRPSDAPLNSRDITEGRTTVVFD